MKSPKIGLTYSCSENWNKMTPTQKGHHCASCNKVVKDFTQYSDQEIIEFLMKNTNTCAKVYEEQLDRPMQYIPVKKSIFNWKMMAAMLVAGTLQLVPSNIYAQQNTFSQEKPIKVDLIKGDAHRPLNNAEITKVDQPRETISITLKFFDNDTKEPIHYAFANNEILGQFRSEEASEIKIELDLDKLPDLIQFNVSAHDYSYKEYSVDKSKLKDVTSFEIYLNFRPMKMGKIAFHD